MEQGARSKFANDSPYGVHLKTGSNGSDNSNSGRSTSHEIQESQTAIADHELETNDSLNGHELDLHISDFNSQESRMKPFRNRNGTEGGGVISRSDAIIPDFEDDDDPDIPDVNTMQYAHSQQVIRSHRRLDRGIRAQHPRSTSADGRRETERRKERKALEQIKEILRIPEKKR